MSQLPHQYTPTTYDIKLEELICKVTESIQFKFETGQSTKEWIDKQKLLIKARSEYFVKHLEISRGLL